MSNGTTARDWVVTAILAVILSQVMFWALSCATAQTCDERYPQDPLAMVECWENR